MQLLKNYRKYFIQSALVFSILMIFGCGSRPSIDLNNFQDVTNHTEIKFDDYDKTTTYTGPGSSTRLVGVKSANGYFNYYFVVETWNTEGWYSFHDAFDANGTKLSIKKGTTDVSCEYKSYLKKVQCDYFELFTIGITKEYLEQHQKEGVSFKLYSSKLDDRYRKLSGQYIKAFLSVAK
jgi:hypothetical protein